MTKYKIVEGTDTILESNSLQGLLNEYIQKEIGHLIGGQIYQDTDDFIIEDIKNSMQKLIDCIQYQEIHFFFQAQDIFKNILQVVTEIEGDDVIGYELVETK